MRFKKEILLFYTMIVLSAGVIIAADQPAVCAPSPQRSSNPKCSGVDLPAAKKPANPPLYYITEGLLRFKA